MDLGRAFTYAFDDPDWLNKLVVVTALAFASVILLPVIGLGLLPLCVLLGYAAEIVENRRRDVPVILPVWNTLTERLQNGANILLAMIIFNLPLILLGCCMYTIPGFLTDTTAGGLLSLSMLCCLGPISLGYLALSWSMLAVGVSRYARTGSAEVFLQAGKLYHTALSLGAFTGQWFLGALVIALVFFLIGIVPCIGWIAAATMALPVQAYFLGQYARYVDKFDAHQHRVA
jgi:hypothetical protein